MRRYPLIALAAGAIGLVAGVASAADLPRKAPAYQPPPPPPPYNWTGFYTGVFLGAGWSRNEFNDASVIFDGGQFFPPGGNSSFGNGVGALGGITVGYNWQMPNSPIVLGIEGEWAWADVKGDAARNHTDTFADTFGCDRILFINFGTCTESGTNNASLRSSSQVKDIATITGRFGLISGPQDRTMWYVKGGGAWVKTNVNVAAQANFNECDTNNSFLLNIHTVNCFGDSNSVAGSRNFNKWGWTVGTGLEFGLWDKWTGKVEYDYINVGSRTFSASVDDISASTQVKQTINVVKIGLNYRWGGWGKAPY